MEIFFGWIIFSFVAGGIGSGRKIGFWGAFLLSLFLSPLIGLIVALASTRNSTIEFQNKMLERQGDPNASALRNRQGLADELSKLERSYLEGKITVYDYESQKDNILRRYQS